MDFHDSFERKITKPFNQGVGGIFSSGCGKVGQAMTDVEPDSQAGIQSHDPEEKREVQRASRMGREGRCFHEKEPAVQGPNESQSSLSCCQGSFPGQEGGSIESKGISFHGFLGAFMNHPGRSKGFHVPIGSKDFFPVGRIVRKIGLGIPQTIPMIGKGSVIGDNFPGMGEVGGPSPKNFNIFRRAFPFVGKSPEKILQWGEIKIGRDSDKGSL
jgi:hypothetical protein